MIADDDDLDARLAEKIGDELRRQIDGQLGRAARHFRDSLDAGSNRSIGGKRRRWIAPVSAMAAAASLALIVAHLSARRNVQLPQNVPGKNKVATSGQSSPPPRRDQPSTANVNQQEPVATADAVAAADATAPSQPLLVARALRSRAIDEGTLLLDGRAVRKIRRQWLERVEWFDPQHGARLERIVPREQIVFLPLSIN